MKKKPSSAGRKSATGRTYKKNTGNDSSFSGEKRSYSDRPDKRGGGEERSSSSYNDRSKKGPYSGRDNSGGGGDDRNKRPYSGRITGNDKFDKSDRPRRFDDDKPKRSFSDKGDKGFGNSDRPRRSDDDRTKRPFSDKRENKPFDKSDRPRPSDNDRPKRSFSDKRDNKPFDKSDRPRRFDDDKPKRSFSDKRDNKPFDKSDRPRRSDDDRPKRSFSDKRDNKPFDKSDRPRRSDDDRPKRSFPGKQDNKGFDKKEEKPVRPFTDRMDKAFRDTEGKKKFEEENPRQIFPDKKIKDLDEDKQGADDDKFERKVSGPFRKKYKADEDKFDRDERAFKDKKSAPLDAEVKEMTLNKYISHSSTSSRRDAAEMVKQGKVKVNGELMLDPGYRVQPYDQVMIAGKKLTPQKGRGYILLNKPKGYITTTEDPEGRKTVMELVEGTEYQKLYPVGRLDRNTTGLLLLTNDGDLAQKLSHPSFETKKVYQASLDKPLTKADFEKIVTGIELEDGPVKVDDLAYLDDKSEIGIEIHSGRNRIVRRIFESLGYEVEKLDRVMYAGLTKKNLPRGKWRELTDKEVILLKHFKV
jgi:23S rRNA pseudouridine2605 synthase